MTILVRRCVSLLTISVLISGLTSTIFESFDALVEGDTHYASRSPCGNSGGSPFRSFQ